MNGEANGWLGALTNGEYRWGGRLFFIGKILGD
jgi:hypothetical protein